MVHRLSSQVIPTSDAVLFYWGGYLLLYFKDYGKKKILCVKGKREFLLLLFLFKTGTHTNFSLDLAFSTKRLAYKKKRVRILFG